MPGNREKLLRFDHDAAVAPLALGRIEGIVCSIEAGIEIPARNKRVSPKLPPIPIEVPHTGTGLPTGCKCLKDDQRRISGKFNAENDSLGSRTEAVEGISIQKLIGRRHMSSGPLRRMLAASAFSTSMAR